MRQRKALVGLLVVAALSLGLVPGTASADPWACAAAWTPAGATNTCTVVSTVTGGALYRGAVKIYVNNVLKFQSNSPDCYHLSTLPVPPGPGCAEAKNIGPGNVRAESLSPGGFVIVGSRG